jgi:glucose/arabinose dehydrogenase
MKKFGLTILLLLFALVTLAFYVRFKNSTSPDYDKASEIPSFVAEKDASEVDIESIPLVSIVAEGLDTPWGLTFLPEGGILLTERQGTVRLIDKEANLLPEPVAEIGTF